MNDMRRVMRRLDDVLKTSDTIALQLDGISRERFLEDVGIQYAIAYALVIIAEAMTAIDQRAPGLLAEHPAIRLRAVKGMRNILIHEYGTVDWNSVYDAALIDLPRLRTAIMELRNTLSP